MFRIPHGHVARVVVPVLSGGVILTAFASAMLKASGAVLGAAAILGLLYGCTTVVLSGLLLVSWTLGDARVPRLVLAILLGSLATSLFLVAGYFLTGRRASVLFVWWSALVAAAAWRGFRRAAPPIGTDLLEVVSVVAIAVLVAFWCRPVASLLPTIHATGLAPIWSDYFIHGTEIAQFGDPLGTGRASFVLSDQPIDLYHFASYMLPASASSLVDVPSLAIASSLLFPYGILLASFGSYVLARTLAGPGIGLLAPAALLLVPDASTYGLRNGFFSVHWFLGASPGTGHALGVAFTALTFAALWRITGRRTCLWVCGLVALALFQVRAQVFLVASPALAATLAAETRFVHARARRLTVAALVSIGAIAAVMVALPAAQVAWLRFSAFETFLEIVHTAQAPSAYDGVYRAFERDHGTAAARALGFVVLIPIVLGGLLVVLPAAMAAAIRRQGWRSLDAFPIWCLVVWLALVLIAPAAGFGDPAAYQYQAFVVVYPMALLWALIMTGRAMQGTVLARDPSRAVIAGVLTIGLGATAVVTWTGNPVKPRLAWGAQYFGTPVDRGFLDAATYVFEHRAPGDTFALLPSEPQAFSDDAATRFAALANVPAYLTRPAMFGAKPNLRAIVERRLAELRQIEATADPNVAFDRLRAMGVTILVALGQRGPPFDPSRARTVYWAGTASVYRIEPESDRRELRSLPAGR